MSTNQLETHLEAITVTIAHLENQKEIDTELIKSLKKERKRILNELNITY